MGPPGTDSQAECEKAAEQGLTEAFNTPGGVGEQELFWDCRPVDASPTAR
jgi:hypothetical protein